MSVTRQHDDRGVTLVIVALSLLALMIFAAFAVDIGGLYAARRSDQNAADMAVMAGLQHSEAQAILDEVDLVASETLEITPGTIDWTACTLTDADYVDLPLVISGTAYTCITQDSSRQALQVKLPTRALDSSFGAVVGIASYSHDAFAIGGVITAGFGGVLPFGLNSTGSSNLQCLKSATSPHSEAPCDGADEGNFGYLDFSFYGNVERQISTTCNGATQERLEQNIAGGIDHDLDTNDPVVATVETDREECLSTRLRAFKVHSQTGATPQTLGRGAYSGTYADGPGRLSRTDPDYTTGAPQVTIDGYRFDDNALWDYMVPVDADQNGVLSVPTSCNQAVFTDIVDHGDYSRLPGPGSDVDIRTQIAALNDPSEATRILMDRCITHYKGTTWFGFGSVAISGGEPSSCPVTGCLDPVFAKNTDNESPDLYDIQYSPRFGYVPQLTTAFPDGAEHEGGEVYHIDLFRAVYLQRIVGGCSTHGGCNLDFEPGLTPAGADANGSAEALTAWVFPPKILPNSLSESDAPYDIGRNRFLRLVR
jgi:Flp pilus assembly protein TadG